MKLKRATETVSELREKARGFFERMLSGDVQGLPPWQVKLSLAMRVLAEAGRELVKDGCFGRASSLAYQTLASFIPVIAISMALFAAMPALSQKKEVFLEWVTDTLLPLPHETEAAPPEEGAEGPATKEAIERAREDVRDFFVATVGALAARAGAVEGLGGIALVFIAISLMYNVERTFNDLWAVQVRRTLVARIMYFTAIGFWMLVLLGISFYASAWLHSAVSTAPGFLQKALFWPMPFIVTSLVLAVLYKIIPHVRVDWKTALVGGAVAGVLWEVTKVFMGLYFTKVVSYAKIYGSLGAFPIFMVWIYVSWVILLFGAELSYCVQNMPPKPRQDRSSSWRAYTASLVMYEIGRAFADGEGAQGTETIAEKLSVPREEARSLCGKLADAGLLAEVWSGETLVGYLPGKPLAKMSLGDVIHVIRGEGMEAPEEAEGHPIGRIFREAETQEKSRLEVTFEDLIARLRAT